MESPSPSKNAGSLTPLESLGCRLKREAKADEKQRDKSGRGRKERAFDNYVKETDEKINEIKALIANTNKKDELKRLNNKISAYKSRVAKRSALEEAQALIYRKNL